MRDGYLQVWRLVNKRWGNDPFSGVGAEEEGGRWNFKGILVVYTAINISLGILETLANLDRPREEFLYLIYWISIPKDAYKEICLNDWPEDVFKRDEEFTQKIGSDWINSQKSVALKVPSIINPYETNFLINPVHPDFKKKLQFCPRNDAKELELDSRLIRHLKGFE